MWRKVTVGIASLALVLTSASIAVAGGLTQVSFGLLIGGKQASLTVLYDAATWRTYAPATDLAAALGAQVKADADGTGTDLVKGSSTVELFAGSDKAKVNGADTAIDAGARSVDGTLYVPIRFVAEHLGYKVGWNGDSHQITADAVAATYTVNIPGDRFDPGILSINAGDTVVWNNADADVHTVVSVPDAPDKFEITLPSGKQGQFTFTKPGAYRYYCSVHAAYDADTAMIKASSTSDMFPAPMEGIIVVNGPGFTETNTAMVDIPHADRFSPVVAVVKAGGTVTWKNDDADVHTVQSVPGAPDSVTVVIKAGESGNFTFTKPGIYWYYCTVHAAWDDKEKAVMASKMSDAFPEPMEGYVVVLP